MPGLSAVSKENHLSVTDIYNKQLMESCRIAKLIATSTESLVIDENVYTESEYFDCYPSFRAKSTLKPTLRSTNNSFRLSPTIATLNDDLFALPSDLTVQAEHSESPCIKSFRGSDLPTLAELEAGRQFLPTQSGTSVNIDRTSLMIPSSCNIEHTNSSRALATQCICKPTIDETTPFTNFHTENASDFWDKNIEETSQTTSTSESDLQIDEFSQVTAEVIPQFKSSYLITTTSSNSKDESAAIYDSQNSVTRKSYKRGGMAAQLEKILQKQQSEVAIWRHEIYLSKTKNYVPSISKGVCIQLPIDNVWKEFGSSFIKCKGESFECLVLLSFNTCSNVFKIGDEIKLFPPYNKKVLICCNRLIECYYNVSKIQHVK